MATCVKKAYKEGRKQPPYNAKDCKNLQKLGQDHRWYVSRSVNGKWRWVSVSQKSPRVSPIRKYSPVRRGSPYRQVIPDEQERQTISNLKARLQKDLGVQRIVAPYAPNDVTYKQISQDLRQVEKDCNWLLSLKVSDFQMPYVVEQLYKVGRNVYETAVKYRLDPKNLQITISPTHFQYNCLYLIEGIEQFRKYKQRVDQLKRTRH
jgi:hypothetical protein